MSDDAQSSDPKRRIPSGEFDLRQLSAHDDRLGAPSRSSWLDAMLESMGYDTVPPPDSDELGGDEISLGDVTADRFEVTRTVCSSDTGILVRARDRMMERDVTLKTAAPGADATGDGIGPLLHELLLARAVSHPHVCRVHDVISSGFGTMLVMEPCDSTLRIRLRDGQGLEVADITRLLGELAEALLAIHRLGMLHGALNPSNVLLEGDRALLVFGVANTNKPKGGLEPSSDSPKHRYFAPERLWNNFPSPGDDIYALGTIGWEMMTGVAPQMGVSPRTTALLAHAHSTTVLGMRPNLLRLLHRALSEDSSMRPSASEIANACAASEDRPQVAEQVFAGPPPAATRQAQFCPGDQSLLVMSAASDPGLVGKLILLERKEHLVGRRCEDVSIAEATLSRTHARFTWQGGAWSVRDMGSSNGIYASHSYEKQDMVLLRHGADVQLGALRLKLVHFAPNSLQHWRARRLLQQRDGLTGTLFGPALLRSLEEDSCFANWIGSNLQLARFQLKFGEDTQETVTLLATRRFCSQVLSVFDELPEIAMSAGVLHRPRLKRGGAVAFYVAMVGVRKDRAKTVAADVANRAGRVLPDGVVVDATVRHVERPSDLMANLGRERQTF